VPFHGAESLFLARFLAKVRSVLMSADDQPRRLAALFLPAVRRAAEVERTLLRPSRLVVLLVVDSVSVAVLTWRFLLLDGTNRRIIIVRVFVKRKSHESTDHRP